MQFPMFMNIVTQKGLQSPDREFSKTKQFKEMYEVYCNWNFQRGRWEGKL